ncbi:MAG: hypothetical protein HN368_10990 [Spirochaetales bacterium]|jgi:hypothetical protein|nr:hypothetical protein [Spirochaetales bacterium]
MAKRLKGRDEFISGLAMTIAFGALWLFRGSSFWLFPMVFAGVVPMVRGGLRFFGNRQLPGRKQQALPKADPEAIERAILATARNEGGRVTPATVALSANISLEKADKALQNLAKQGYSSMEVRDNGTLEYVFPEFLP